MIFVALIDNFVREISLRFCKFKIWKIVWNWLKMFNSMDSSVVLLSSNTFSMLLMCAAVAALVFFIGIGSKNKRLRQRPPGPKTLPIIGNLASLQGYEVPYQAFNDLADKFGPVVGLILGSTPTVVVNDSQHVKEVLITKASHFDNRPNFYRYNHLFNGNRQQCEYHFCVYPNHAMF